MALDRKYGNVTTEFGDIPPDEPVIILRGRDVIVPELLKRYRYLCRNAGSPDYHLGLIDESRDAIQDWQAANPLRVRIPDSANHAARVREG